MLLEKAKVVEALRDAGLDERAGWVNRQMPDLIDAKATEPTLAAELIAAYAAGAGFVPRVKLWPAEPLSGWEGRPDGAGQPPAGRPGLVRALV